MITVWYSVDAVKGLGVGMGGCFGFCLFFLKKWAVHANKNANYIYVTIAKLPSEDKIKLISSWP